MERSARERHRLKRDAVVAGLDPRDGPGKESAYNDALPLGRKRKRGPAVPALTDSEPLKAEEVAVEPLVLPLRSPTSDHVEAVAARLRDQVSGLHFTAPYVYNPYEYAWPIVQRYIHKHARSHKTILYLGMNPGPFGMAQTGIPFGDVQCVQQFVGVRGPVDKPPREHPKRPVTGFACVRREVSGTRFWGLMAALHGSGQQGAEAFFSTAWVHNYCPLAFMASQGANVTPDKLPAKEREPLFAFCDQALVDIVRALRPRIVIGVGKFAEDRARKALGAVFPDIQVEGIPHPSPANPRANKHWADDTMARLTELGLLSAPR